jgi:hypothetical protein
MGLFRRKDQVAALKSERKAERSFAKRRRNMKTIVAAVLLVAAIASPALAQRTQSQQGAQSGQNAGGTYQGYSTKEWQRPGSW